jgi:hypothetical protein
MSRENLFRSTFETQFAAFSGWRRLYTSHGLAPSDYPGFQLTLGETVYLSFSAPGNPMSGRQEFSLRLLFTHAQLQIPTALSTRSDLVQLLESFIGSIYVPPPIAIGDLCRIEGVAMDRIEGSANAAPDTRSMITLHGYYYFTNF